MSLDRLFSTEPVNLAAEVQSVFLILVLEVDTGDRRHQSPGPLSLDQSSLTDGADCTSADEKPISLSTKYAPKETAIVNANAANIVFIVCPLPAELERLWPPLLQPRDHDAGVPTRDRLDHCPLHQRHLPYRHFQYRCAR